MKRLAAMKITVFIFCLALLTLNRVFAGAPIVNIPKITPSPWWASIQYPWNLPKCPTFLIGWPIGTVPGEFSRGLRMDILNIRQGAAFFKTNSITARLYRADGQNAEPTKEGKELLNSPVEISTKVMTYFPWGPNVLQESWIEVTIPPERYWVEVPYGFDRNPADPLAPANTNGPPRFIPEMNLLTEHDYVVRWDKVNYDLGRLPDGSELKLMQSNPFNAQSEVNIYNDRKVESIDSPRIELSLFLTDGTVVTGRCVNMHIGNDPVGRTDTFDLYPYRGDLRDWGRIEVRVGDITYKATVPSSLYNYIHGHASEPAAVDYLSKLRIGMTLDEADMFSRNYVNDGIRKHPVPSAPGQYRARCWDATNEVTLQFDQSDALVGWRGTAQ